ncbi:MAG: hypothetical protein A2751_03225 [Candidatus Doudnabacteria bacterium RIFCSPHIGHO2_01_FULL_46_14]|uniref:Gfo/Idh/MocA-like oxidoreductase N-terminal domain-containing protein n=1 Tax=Candidatus Doudnabacteria bacterium RIFCSPHIGHO2_01_FULL_46_14 TaxID=1817824 RepID=A0A1F5NKK6_9BACT|nr:MAG: hypothetical protein A2751_03225 [Candidatus Doudnabacteria bacterium RIFCSPHIGHO2_01_FULL_46_14]
MGTLGFGVIGTGRFGQHYTRLLREIQGVFLLATASQHENNSEALLENPDIDCVVIASPAATHFEYIKKALKNGKHVLVEKPMVTSAAEAEEIKILIAKSGKIFMVAHQYLYNDYIRALKARIESGDLGEGANINAEHLYPGPIRQDVGVFWDAAPHEMAIIDYLFGPSRVIYAQGIARKVSGAPVDDYVSVDVQFENKVFASLLYNSASLQKTHRIVLTASKGTAIYDDMADDKLKFNLGKEPVIEKISAREPLRSELEHFTSCVRNNTLPLTDIDHGLRVIKNLEMVYEHLN